MSDAANSRPTTAQRRAFDTDATVAPGHATPTAVWLPGRMSQPGSRATRPISGGRTHPFDSGNHEVHNPDGQRMHDPGDDEQRHVGMKPLQGVSRHRRDYHSPHRAGGPANSNHGGDILLRKHVR